MKRRTQPSSYPYVLRLLANNVRYLRKEKAKITQEDMTLLGFDKRYIQKLESGRYGPSLQTIVRLAEVFGVTPKDLLDKDLSKKT